MALAFLKQREELKTQRNDLHSLSPSVNSVALCFKNCVDGFRLVNQDDFRSFAIVRQVDAGSNNEQSVGGTV